LRYPTGCAGAWPTWPTIPAEALEVVREPHGWPLDPGPRRSVAQLIPALRRGLIGCIDERWELPPWLMPHQQDAARRLAGALKAFHGGLLADAVGLGKSYVSLALATRYSQTVVLAPASLVSQWRRLAARYEVPIAVASHESLSRGSRVPQAGLIVVDEAHRFRNTNTKRYDALARQVGQADLLLVSATAVVNRGADLINLLRLFLPDHGVAALGVMSLERALQDGEFEAIMHAVSPMVVGRSARTAGTTRAMPRPVDSALKRLGTLAPGPMQRVVTALDALQFPCFTTDASALLRQHIFYRLASSKSAFRQSIRRHRTYLGRAIDAARQGTVLSRGAARALFGPDEQPQLEIPFLQSPNGISCTSLEHERLALEAILDSISSCGPSPKVRELVRIIRSRTGRRTLVFTIAEATASELAGALDWERVAAVSGRNARIASGVIPRDEVFSLFAPRARGAAPPTAALTIDTLIATDLASEGLDLQDADAIIHFDLPWTPLRLEQRLGRIARLGSLHSSVCVWWFAPTPALERRLGLARRIGSKLITQFQLAVTSSSQVGRARVVGGILDDREQIAAGSRARIRGHATVVGRQEALCVLCWQLGDIDVLELTPTTANAGYRSTFARLAHAMPSSAELSPVHLQRIAALAGRRLSGLTSGPTHACGRRLVRRLLASARLAGRRRDRRMIDLLDQSLDRVHHGLAAGAERQLESALDTRTKAAALTEWLRRTPRRRGVWHGPRLEVIVAGDESDSQLA
jgi:hypothetical protein